MEGEEERKAYLQQEHLKEMLVFCKSLEKKKK